MEDEVEINYPEVDKSTGVKKESMSSSTKNSICREPDIRSFFRALCMNQEKKMLNSLNEPIQGIRSTVSLKFKNDREDSQISVKVIKSNPDALVLGPLREVENILKSEVKENNSNKNEKLENGEENKENIESTQTIRKNRYSRPSVLKN